MFYLPLAVLTWIMAYRVIDWRRFGDLLPHALWAAVLCTVEDRLSWMLNLWIYYDTGPIRTHLGISTLISLSAAPVFGMYFAQKLTADGAPPWRRIAKATAVSLVPEVIGLYTGHIRYGHWNIWLSILAYIGMWLSFWWLHRWLAQPCEAACASADGARPTPG